MLETYEKTYLEQANYKSQLSTQQLILNLLKKYKNNLNFLFNKKFKFNFYLEIKNSNLI